MPSAQHPLPPVSQVRPTPSLTPFPPLYSATSSKGPFLTTRISGFLPNLFHSSLQHVAQSGAWYVDCSSVDLPSWLIGTLAPRDRRASVWGTAVPTPYGAWPQLALSFPRRTRTPTYQPKRSTAGGSGGEKSPEAHWCQLLAAPELQLPSLLTAWKSTKLPSVPAGHMPPAAGVLDPRQPSLPPLQSPRLLPGQGRGGGWG